MNKTRVTLTYDQWYALFRPFEDNEGLLVEIVDETAIRTLHVSNKLWTEMDNGDIQSGIHIVNRMRYLATITPYPKDTEVYVCEEGDSPHLIYFAVERHLTPYDGLYRDGQGLPYVFWSIRDGLEFMESSNELAAIGDDFVQRYCAIDQEGQRYNWDGTEVHEDE